MIQQRSFSSFFFFFFPVEGPREQFWHGQRCPVCDVVHQVFPLLITLHGALKDGFVGEAVMA